MDREKVIERIHEAIDMGVCVDLFMDILELLKEQDAELEWCERCGRVRLKSKWEGA